MSVIAPVMFSQMIVDAVEESLGDLGRGEDPISQVLAAVGEAALTVSYALHPGLTEELLLELEAVGDLVDATVTFIDDATGNRVSKLWNELDPETQDELRGTGKILSVFLPGASVKTLRVLRPTKRVPDVPRSGTLTQISDDVWESAGGLRYGPDPNFGNRVQHVIRHATDDPARPGLHGVFDAGQTRTLGVIDDAWKAAQTGARE